MKGSNTDDNNFLLSRNPRVNSMGRILNEYIISAKEHVVLLPIIFKLMLV